MRLALLAALVVGCGSAPPRTTVRYPASTDDVLNPERGFVVDVDLIAGGDLSSVRARGSTLGYAAIHLDDYRDAPLPPALLAALTTGFAAVRAAGIKVIIRFVYNADSGGADASKEQILGHLAQLQPVLAAGADVIAVMDAGFIGAWGEWHTSIHDLDNPRDRGDILYAILAALPPSRSVIVRSPIYKADAYGGPLTEAHAFDGSAPSRVGHLDGCFLGSETDLGTYVEPIETWKAFVAAEGRFTPVGGETCKLHPPRTDCATATAELARMHWSFLNSLYHAQVLAAWQDQDCYDEIGRRLGYRLELARTTFDAHVAPGGRLHVTVELVNTGYAAMFNARPVYLVLDDDPVLTAIDPRRWEPGAPIRFTVEVPIPVTTTAGRHRLGLWLPDADPVLRDLEAYAVRLANTRWDAGINVLSDDVLIDARGMR